MTKDHQLVMESLSEYASPKAKLTRMLKSGTLIQVRRGLFVEQGLDSPLSLAPLIYGPSYLSFQFALAWHGLIPERVTTLSSASYGKNKDRHYQTALGTFSYLYLPIAVYPYGILRLEENGQPFLLASPEKALCDQIYKAGSVASKADLEDLILGSWRMEIRDLARLDHEFINWLAPRYHRKAMIHLPGLLKKCRDTGAQP